VITLTDISALARVEQNPALSLRYSSQLAQPLELEDKLASLARAGSPGICGLVYGRSDSISGGLGVQWRRYERNEELEAQERGRRGVSTTQPQRFESLRRVMRTWSRKFAGPRLVTGARALPGVARVLLSPIPMIARGSAFGAITLASFAGRSYLRPQDLGFRGELDARAANAIDNARLYREAQDAVKARDEFMSIAAHEMRTPLMALRFNSAL